MGNQQVTDDVRSAWLAALIDGEGCFSIYAQHKHTPSLMTHVNIANSDPRLIATAHAILKGWSVGCYVSTVKTPGLPSWRVDVRGYKRCSAFLPRILPWLISKRAEADIMWRLIQYRLSMPHQFPYGETEAKLVALFKDIKNTRHLTDFVPDPRYMRGEDKVEALVES